MKRNDKNLLMTLGMFCLAGLVWSLIALFNKVVFSQSWQGEALTGKLDSESTLSILPTLQRAPASRELASVLSLPEVFLPCSPGKFPERLETYSRHVQFKIKKCRYIPNTIGNSVNNFEATIFREYSAISTDLIPLDVGHNKIKFKYQDSVIKVIHITRKEPGSSI